MDTDTANENIWMAPRSWCCFKMTLKNDKSLYLVTLFSFTCVIFLWTTCARWESLPSLFASVYSKLIPCAPCVNVQCITLVHLLREYLSKFGYSYTMYTLLLFETTWWLIERKSCEFFICFEFRVVRKVELEILIGKCCCSCCCDWTTSSTM